MGISIAVAVAIGTAIGAAMHNVAMGVAFGAAFGVAAGALLSFKAKIIERTTAQSAFSQLRNCSRAGALANACKDRIPRNRSNDFSRIRFCDCF
jgi:hypothetical protein